MRPFIAEFSGTYNLIRSKRKTVSLQILPSGELVVRAPVKYPQNEIEKFINLRRRWIQEKKDLVKDKILPNRNYAEGEEYLYLGDSYKLFFADYPHIFIDYESRTLSFPKREKEIVKENLAKWYFEQAKKFITDRATQLAEDNVINIKRISISRAQTRWGSCSGKNTINLSYRLIMAPVSVLDYVIIHELAHTIHHNHSKAFWSKVKEMMPDYRDAEKWLKENAQRMSV